VLAARTQEILMNKHRTRIIRAILMLAALALTAGLLGTRPLPVSAQQNVFYVAPGGSRSGDGSQSSPWDLQTALNQPASVRPGATIWLRGGTYRGTFTSQLKGADGAPITVRAISGERVILLHASDGPALDLGNTHYVHFWGLEIAGPDAKRSTSRSKMTYGARVHQGSSSHNIKLINMIFRDAQAQGIGWWQAGRDMEIYGSLFYFNGTDQLDHGVYAHNVNGSKIFRDNVVFDNASHGFHGYAETVEKGLNNLVLDGNTFFNNGSVGYNTKKSKYGEYKRNILVGGLIPANNAVITNNYTYYPGKDGASLNLGYEGGTRNARVSGNYFMGGRLDISGGASELAFSGNTIYAPGGVKGMEQGGGNTWHNSRPGGVQIFVRPNAYEPNRAHITIYNWAYEGYIRLSADQLSGVKLAPGQAYELRNVQNYFGDVTTGVYNGREIGIITTGRSVAQPQGLGFKPASSFPHFGVFVLIAK
jgi:hypothetical protein